ncbi:MAG: response regulator transcription factor [Pseudomonadota bacterium]
MHKLLIADDHDLVCEAIAAYLSAAPDFTVHTAANLDEAIVILRDSGDIDLAIFDYRMPGMDGLDGLGQVRAMFPDVRVALMSGVASPTVVRDALAQGAEGYLPKSLPVSKMIAAVRDILDGQGFVPVDDIERQAALHKKEAWDLSTRELEVLEKLCLGRSNKQIAEELGVKLVTAKLHVANIMSKMGVDNRTQAVVLAKEKHIF